MLADTIDTKQTFKAFLIFTGGYFFAVCFIIPIHEIGHALSMVFLGVEGVKITFNPFNGNTTYDGTISDANMNLVLLGGFLFDITVATILIIISFLEKLKNILLLRFIGFVAYFIEGTVALGTLTTSIIITDWAGLVYLGLPSIFVLIIGIVLVVVASAILFTIWSLLDLSHESSFIKLILISMGFLIHNLFSFVIAIILLSTDDSDIGNFMINLFYVEIIIFTCLLLIFKFVIPRVNENLIMKENVITNKTVYISLCSGMTMFIVSVLSSTVTWVIT